MTSLTERAEDGVVINLPQTDGNNNDPTPLPPIAESNTAPVIEETQDGFLGINASANTVDENIDTTSAVKIGTVTPLGKDTSNLTYNIVGAGNGLFSVDQSGNLYVKQGASIDFESASSHNIVLRTTNQNGKAKTKSLTITINDVNDAPSAVSLSNAAVPDQLIYNTVEVITENVLVNNQFTNNGENWTTYSDSSDTYPDTFNNNVWRSGRDWSQIKQHFLPIENGYSTYDGAAGVSIVYRLEKA